MRLGIGTYTFPWAFSLATQEGGMTSRTLLEFAREHQIRHVQFGDNYPLHQCVEGELNEIMGFASQHDIKLEVGTKGLTKPNATTYIQLARKLGSPFVRIVIDDDEYAPSTEEIKAILTDLQPVLREENIILAIENHDRLRSSELKELILTTDENYVGVCLDTANSLGANEGINEVLENLQAYVVNLHIKDITIRRLSHKMGFLVEGAAAGDGVINIPELIERLSYTNRCQSATLELWSGPAENMIKTLEVERERAIRSIQYLKQYIP